MRNKNETREAILDATDRLMGRYGFRKMTMDDLAREAEISKKTIYLHFRDKEDVGLSSIGRVVEGTHDRLEQVRDSSDTADSKLRQMLMLRVMGRIESIKDYYWSLDELFAVVRPAYMTRRKQYFEREVELLSAVLEEGVLGGIFECESIQATARALVQSTNAFLPYSLSVRELGAPGEIAVQLKVMVDVLLRGLLKASPKQNGERI